MAPSRRRSSAASPASDAAAQTRPRGLQHHWQARAGVSAGSRRKPRWTRITARLRHDFPEVYPPNGGLTFGIVPLMEQVVGDVRSSSVLLLGAVGFVLLIACANVANLQLSRAVARQKEIAVRSALGATRSRIIRQLLTESVLLALAVAHWALLLAFAASAWIRLLGPQSVPRLSDIGIDATALAFTFVISVLSGFLFGMAPALRLARLDVQTTLQDTSRTSAGVSAIWGHGSSLRRLLVITELALCTMLLIGAGLLIRSFYRVKEVPPGIQSAKCSDAGADHVRGRNTRTRQPVLASYHELWQRLETCPALRLPAQLLRCL